MVETHETPSSIENSSMPEENSNQVSEKTQSITDEPLPNPSSTEAPIEKTSDAKTIKWEQELKSNGYILCDCRTGFLDLKGKSISISMYIDQKFGNVGRKSACFLFFFFDQYFFCEIKFALVHT